MSHSAGVKSVLTKHLAFVEQYIWHTVYVKVNTKLNISRGKTFFKQDILFQFDFENRIHGANFLAYPPVVAGGNRANTLHYINNNQIIKVKTSAERAWRINSLLWHAMNISQPENDKWLRI